MSIAGPQKYHTIFHAIEKLSSISRLIRIVFNKRKFNVT